MNAIERARLANAAGKIVRVRAYLADETKDYHDAFTALDAAQREIYGLLNWQWPPPKDEAPGRPIRTPTDEGHRRTDRSVPDNNDGV